MAEGFTQFECFFFVVVSFISQAPKKRHPSDEDASPGSRRKRISTDNVESDSTTVLS